VISKFSLLILTKRKMQGLHLPISISMLTTLRYERVFTRINERLPHDAAREKARKILGWIGCSPVPLTVREVEQALLINVGDLDQLPTSMVGLSASDLVRICGPVVDDIEGELHFVHFTAKEYDRLPTTLNICTDLTCTQVLLQPEHQKPPQSFSIHAGPRDLLHRLPLSRPPRRRH
jgi:hypothetical protein